MPNQKSHLSLLLGRLPADVSVQKRRDIDQELTELGEYQHYKQSVRRAGYNLKNTHIACAYVLKKHLGITDEFFVGDDEERERQCAEILKKAYENHLAV